MTPASLSAVGAAERNPQRHVLAAAGVAVAALVVFAVIFLLASRSAESRAEAGARAAPAPAEPVPLDPTVATEELAQAVEEHPEDVALRLRLAHRYFDDGDGERALQHYLHVLEREQHPEALSHAGWIAFEAGDVRTANRLVEESVARRPDDPEALWYLANIRLHGLGDARGAMHPLETLLGRASLSEEFRREVEALVQEARSRPA